MWSFAVTMWELLSMARDKPFPHLTNEQVIQNAEQMYYGGELQVSDIIQTKTWYYPVSYGNLYECSMD